MNLLVKLCNLNIKHFDLNYQLTRKFRKKNNKNPRGNTHGSKYQVITKNREKATQLRNGDSHSQQLLYTTNNNQFYFKFQKKTENIMWNSLY
jgi:hypothetical protein